MNIIQAMQDPHLFGDAYADASFDAWRALLSAFYGLDLSAEAQDTFSTLTGRSQAATEAHRELWVAVGRRGGKSHVAALIAVYEAAFRDHRAKLAPGEVATVMLLAADRPQARTLLRYVRGLFERPMLRKMVRKETVTGFELANRSAIEIHTASATAVRGYTLAAAICDEIAFWPSQGANPDAEVIAALRPALATLDGRLIAISSPYARRGMLWQQYKAHFGKADSRVLVAQAPSRIMNPSLPARVVDDAMRDDAARASAEWLAQFRSDIEAFVSTETVEGATRPSPLTLPAVDGTRYFAFADPGGGGKDEYTLAIGHRVGNGITIDRVEGRRGNPAAITADFCAILSQYRIRRVSGDRYAGAWPPTEFARHGIVYEASPGTRSELYSALLPALTSGAVELPPCETLVSQLVALERRTTRGGRDIIDHPPGGHDDRANALAGAVAVALRKNTVEPRVRGFGDVAAPAGRLVATIQNPAGCWAEGVTPKRNVQKDFSA